VPILEEYRQAYHHEPINVWCTDLPYGLHIRKTGDNPPHPVQIGMVTTIKITRTNSLKCLPKHGGAQDNKIMVSHQMIDHCERCLTSAIAR
jgi:hypothetical protein